jgi:hypothetical protein
MNKGLWTQLSEESQKKVHKMWLKRQNMSDSEKLEEFKNSINRVFKLLDDIIISLYQDANIDYINNQN